jgi:TolB-like protein/Tfp pilus assembly protein PilF
LNSEKIFISYAREDDTIARTIADDLRSSNFQLWIDQEDIAPGQHWDRAIESAIDECDAFLVLLSAKSTASDVVLDEINYALEQNKRVFPVIVESCRVPLRLRRLESVEFDPDDDASLERLVAAISQTDPRLDQPIEEEASFAYHPGQHHVPSIALLPFKTSGTGDSTSVLSDGLLTETVEALSLYPGLFVIASATSRTYRDASITLEQIARELRVSYLLVGQLAVVGETLRVSCELVSARSGQIVWSEHFDREIEDLFLVQDEITRAIVRRLLSHITAREREKAMRKAPENLTAWEIMQRVFYYEWSYEWLTDSIDLLRRAIEIDPTLAEAHALLAARLAYMLWYGEFDKVVSSLAHAERALKLAPNNTHCLVCSSVAHNANGDVQRALHLVERAVDLNPNSADAWGYNGLYLAMTGRNTEALEMLDYAFELSPKDPVRYLWYAHRAICYANQGDYAAVLEACQASTRLHDQWFWSFMVQAQAHAMLGHHAEARRDWQAAKRLNKAVTVANFEGWLRGSSLNTAQQEAVVSAVRESGCE